MDFISFSLNYWEDLWQSRHQIMEQISLNHKVLFVSPAFTREEVLAQLRGKRRLPKSGLVRRSHNLHTLVFPKWLVHFYRFRRLAKITAYLRRAKIRRIIKKLGFQDTVVFIWHPDFSEMVGKFGEILSCYYVDDQFAEYADQTNKEKQNIVEREKELLRQVDVVFVNGTALLEIKNPNGNAVNVPMAADFNLFSKSREAETPLPQELEAIPHPRIGYIGNINEKVDFNVLLHVATKKPDWSIVIVGPINVRLAKYRTEFDRLRALPNVTILGSKPRELLPNYIKGLDVCLLCYRLEAWAVYVYPLKLHEYFASGKPIVGTSLKSILEFDQLVRFARTPDEWVKNIAEALNDHDTALAELRVQAAYENRLEERIRLITGALEERLKNKRVR
jgi:glycosyltransferase involved in cell wall biosynthesis